MLDVLLHIDKRLLSIKPISELSRAPQSVNDRAHCKASEFRSFLLYYSLPIMKDTLPDNYFQHFTLLVTAIRKLLGTSINRRDIAVSTKYLEIFCKHHALLYGDKEMTANIHSLLHLVDTVEDLGPLWVYSCFYFKSLNGLLLKYVHGTQGIGLQFLENFFTLQSFPLLNNMPPLPNFPHFFKSIAKYLSVDTKGLGKADTTSLTKHELTVFNEIGYNPDIVRRYPRLAVNGTTYSSVSWKETQKRHNITVCLVLLKELLMQAAFVRNASGLHVCKQHCSNTHACKLHM